VISDQPADTLVPGHAAADQANVLNDAGSGDPSKKADLETARPINEQIADRMAVAVERAGKGRTEVSDRHKPCTAVPPRGHARVDVVREHVISAEQRRRTANALQPVDIRDLVGRRARAVAAPGAQERAATDREIGGREGGQARRDLTPGATLQGESAGID